MAFSVLLFAEEKNALVAISADGAKTSYVLADVQRIEVNKKDVSASMSVQKVKSSAEKADILIPNCFFRKLIPENVLSRLFIKTLTVK